MARYRFGRCTLDERAGEFRRDGAALHLQSKAYELLRMLVMSPGMLLGPRARSTDRCAHSCGFARRPPREAPKE